MGVSTNYVYNGSRTYPDNGPGCSALARNMPQSRIAARGGPYLYAFTREKYIYT